MCSSECSAALRAAHPDLVPLQDARRHALRAASTLTAADKALTRAAAEASLAITVPLANAALMLGGAPIGLRDDAAGQRIGLVWTEAGAASRPLQQAVLHLVALGALGVKLDDSVSQIAGCDVDRLSTDVAVAGDQCDTMLARIKRAEELVRTRYAWE